MKTFAHRLRHERQLHTWSQEQLAEMIGTTAHNVSRWECGSTLPSIYYRQKLCELFGKTAEELGFLGTDHEREGQPIDNLAAPRHLSPTPPEAAPLFWNPPRRHNLLFTGREAILAELQRALDLVQTGARPPIQAITGLGGMGKTQTALEYAYRFAQAYQSTLWIRADTRETLYADLGALAEVLQLGVPEGLPLEAYFETIKEWLQEHRDWLLIVDNLEDLALLHEILPVPCHGHILVTMRLQATGPEIERFDLEKMAPEEGALFLLRRAKRLSLAAPLEQAPHADRQLALTLAEQLDGLPLALDQAGAYIEESNCGLVHYAELFQRQQADLLGLRDLSGGAYADHPRSVRTTLALSLDQLQRENPAALELLQFCAFLHPEAIPETLLHEGAAELGPLLEDLAREPLHLDQAMADLRRYSLLQRHPETHTYSLHRLVQAVVQDTLEAAAQREWARRVVRVVSRAFPEEEYATWKRCQQLLPHALQCARLIEQWEDTTSDAAQLLFRTGRYLKERGAYVEALQLVERALAIREQTLGATHPDVGEILNELAILCYLQGKYEQALPLYERALAINEQTQGSTHSEVAANLNNLAALHYKQGKYEQALPLYERALAINEQTQGSTHPLVAANLNNLAELYRKLNRYEQALLLYQRVLVIKEQTMGPSHPSMATSLNNLAMLYHSIGQYEQALPLFERALAIREQAFGLTHPEVSVVLSNLADLYRERGQYEQALPLFERALAILEGALGPTYPAIARCLEKYALLLRAMQQQALAEVLESRVRAIYASNRSPV